MTAELRTDDALLELAEVVLRNAGFNLRYGQTDDQEPILLIENSDAVAAIGAFVTVPDLLEAESGVSRALSTNIAAAPPSAKRWDGYVVLLTSSRGGADRAEELSLLTQNLRHVRRIVRVAVDPTRAGIARALRPLLPLSSSSEVRWIADPLDAIARLLERDGFTPGEIQREVETFRLTRKEESSTEEMQEPGAENDGY